MKKIRMKSILFGSLSSISMVSTLALTVVSCSNPKSASNIGDNNQGNQGNQDNKDNKVNETLLTNIKDIEKEFSSSNKPFIISDMSYKNQDYDEFIKNVKSGPLTEEEFFWRQDTPHFFASDLKNWKEKQKNRPSKIHDNFFISTIPLNKREYARKNSVNSKQENSHKLSVLATMSKSTTDTLVNTVSIKEARNAIYNMWNYTDRVVAWGGSTSEGQFLLPKAEDTDIAHMNGTKMLATYFASPSTYGGTSRMYDDLIVKDEENNYLVADAMIDLANHYGFDGWFLNLEAPTSGVEQSKEIGKFIKYLNDKSGKLDIDLYQWGEGENHFNENNFSNFYVDFQARTRPEYASNANNTKTTFGYDFDKWAYEPQKDNFNLTDYSNTWIYDYFKHDNLNYQSEAGDLKFFSGYKKENPNWKPMNSWFSETTTILDENKPFSTAFSLGLGKNIFINKEEQELNNYFSNNGYKNIGLQDILPTYRYLNYYLDNNDDLVNEDWQNEELVQEIKLSDNAYFGSNVLEYNYEFDSAVSKLATKLFATNMELKKDATFKFIYKKHDSNESLDPSLALWTDENSLQEFEVIQPIQTEEIANDYFELTFKVPQNLENKKLFSFGTLFEKKPSKLKVKIDLSFVSYNPPNFQTSQNASNKLKDVDVIYTKFIDGKRTTAFDLKFEHLDTRDVKMNIIYSSKEENNFIKDKIVGISNNNSIFIGELPQYKNVPLIVETYNYNHKKILKSEFVLRTTFNKIDNPDLLSVQQIDFNKDGNQELEIRPSGGFVKDAYLSTIDDKGNEEVFLLDNAGALQKIDKHGKILINEFNFGTPLFVGGSKQIKDIEKAKLFDINKDNILIAIQNHNFWQDRTYSDSEVKLALINKKTGEMRGSLVKSSDIKDVNQLFLINQDNKKAVFLVNNESNPQKLVIDTKNGALSLSNLSDIDNYQSENLNKIIYVDPQGKFLIVKNTSDLINLYKIESSSINDLSLEKYISQGNSGTTFENIKDSVKAISNFQEISQVVKTSPLKIISNNQDVLKFFLGTENDSTLKKINYFRILKNNNGKDNFLMINNKGLIMLFDENMKIIHSNFLLDKKTYEDVDKELLVHKGQQRIRVENDIIRFINEDENNLTFLVNKERHPWATYGIHGDLPYGFIDFDVKDFVNKSSINVKALKIKANDESSNKKIDYSFKIILKPISSKNYLVLDSGSAIRAFNKSDDAFEQEFIPQIILKYDDEILVRQNLLYKFEDESKSSWLKDNFIQENMK